MDQILSDIQARLTAELPEIKYIDEDWGQMNQPTPQVKYPCVLVDVQGADYKDLGLFAQEGVVVVAVRLYNLKLGNSSQGAPSTQKEKYKTHWQLLKEINIALHAQNFLQEGLGLLKRTKFTKRIREDGLLQFELLYTLSLTDESCVPTLTTPDTVTPSLRTVTIQRV